LTIKTNIFIMAFIGATVTHFIRALTVRSDPPKEGAMKRSLALSVGIATFLLAMATWVSAATMDDIAGTWGVYSKSTGKVSKVGSDRSEGLGWVEFIAGPESTGAFDYHDPSRGYNYTGDFVLSPDGKTLTMQFDAVGRSTFENMMRDWLSDAALWKDLDLRNIDFVCDENGIVLKPVKISKKTNGPTKGTVTAKGIVYADVYESGEFIFRGAEKFSFKGTITVLGKQ
jgi:hypothetical protein